MPHLIFCRRIMSLILPLPFRYLLLQLFRRPCTRDRVFQYDFVLLLLFRTDLSPCGTNTRCTRRWLSWRASPRVCMEGICTMPAPTESTCRTRCCYNYEKGYRCRSYHSIRFINKELIVLYFEFTSKLSLSYSSIHWRHTCLGIFLSFCSFILIHTYIPTKLQTYCFYAIILYYIILYYIIL